MRYSHPHQTPRERAIEATAAIAAVAGGLVVFALIFAWPVLIGRDSILLTWGWIGAIVGLFAAHRGARYVRRWMRRALWRRIT